MRAQGAPWLEAVLSALLSTAEHDLLLQACLAPGKAGQKAWQRYRARVGNPRERLGGDPRARVLAPLLHQALLRHEPADAAFHTYLRAAYVREGLRSRTRTQIAARVLAALGDAQIDAIALGETALGETVYDDPALRHSGALDLLVHDADVARALQVMRPLEFAPRPAGPGRPGHSVLFHDTGLPLLVRRRLFRWPCYELSAAATWERSQPGMIAGVPVRLLDPADGLIQVCGDVFDGPGAPSLQWAVDAWALVRRSPTLDWEILAQAASRGGLAVPLAVTLGYLARTLDIAVPADVLAHLRGAATRADPLARDVGLMAARSGSWRGLWRSLSCAPGWAARGAVVGHTLFPSRAYLGLIEGRGDPGPAAYLRRLGRLARGAALASARMTARPANRA